MQCPRCQTEMEQGRLNLKGWGNSWPFTPAAELRFNSELLFQNWCWPVIGWLNTDGTMVPASRCKACHVVLFEYPDPNAK
jgi:hypothetical protein